MKLFFLFILLLFSPSLFAQETLVVTYAYRQLKQSEGMRDAKGNRQGKWLSWHMDGKLASEEHYVDGLRNGICKYYRGPADPTQFDTVSLKSNPAVYEKCLLDQQQGLKGEIYSEESLVKEVLDGESIRYRQNTNGMVEMRVPYKLGSVFGLEKSYNSAGDLLMIAHRRGSIIDSTETFSEGRKSTSIREVDGMKVYSMFDAVRLYQRIYDCSRIPSKKYSVDCKWDESKKGYHCDTIYADGKSQTHHHDEEKIIVVVPEPKDKDAPVSDEIFVVVDTPPTFSGGEEALNTYVASNLKYDRERIGAPISGKVYVSFVVWKDGSLGDIKVLRGINTEADRAALEMVKSMPRWIPGSQRGITVSVQYILPVVIDVK